MSARAIFKGVLRLGEESVPVKLYSAVTDRSVHFRLLHRRDKAPVRQVLVNPDTGETVNYRDAQRAWVSEAGDQVLLHAHELSALKPAKSRDLIVRQFLPQQVLDHRWYDRPYYLGPDQGGEPGWRALAAALGRSRREGLVQWVMRDKRYIGALRLHDGVPMLITLRFAGQVVPLEALTPPSGRNLDARERHMATQLIEMLEAPFEPEQYQDEYRQDVLDMLRRKQAGRQVRKKAAARPARAETSLRDALRASLAEGQQHG